MERDVLEQLAEVAERVLGEHVVVRSDTARLIRQRRVGERDHQDFRQRERGALAQLVVGADRLAPVGVEEIRAAQLLADRLQIGCGLVHVQAMQRLRLGELIVQPRRVAHRRQALDLLLARTERRLREEARGLALRRHDDGLRRGIGAGPRRIGGGASAPAAAPGHHQQRGGRRGIANATRADLPRARLLDCLHERSPNGLCFFTRRGERRGHANAGKLRLGMSYRVTRGQKTAGPAVSTAGSNSRTTLCRKAERTCVLCKQLQTQAQIACGSARRASSTVRPERRAQSAVWSAPIGPTLK